MKAKGAESQYGLQAADTGMITKHHRKESSKVNTNSGLERLQQSELYLLQGRGLCTLASQVLVGALQLLTQLCYLISCLVGFRLWLLLLQELLMLLQQLTMRCAELVYVLQSSKQSAITIDECSLIQLYRVVGLPDSATLSAALLSKHQ